MRAADDTHRENWFDGCTPRDHFRDAAHLLARLLMLLASMACQ